MIIIHFHFLSFLTLDLPKLQTIFLNDGLRDGKLGIDFEDQLYYIDDYDVYCYDNDYKLPLAGDDRDHRKTLINGRKSFGNTLIMKSK